MMHQEICFGFQGKHTKSDEKIFHVGGPGCLDLLVVCSWSAAIYTPHPCLSCISRSPQPDMDLCQDTGQWGSEHPSHSALWLPRLQILAPFYWQSLSRCFISNRQLCITSGRQRKKLLVHRIVTLQCMGMSWTINKIGHLVIEWIVY